MDSLRAIMVVALTLLAGDLFADRWLIERGPSPADLAADASALPAAAELLIRRDLAELQGVALASKADVKSDIITLELNRLSSAEGDTRVSLGLYARAKALVAIDITGGATPQLTLRAIDLTQPAQEKSFSAPLDPAKLEESAAALCAQAAEFLGRKPTPAQLARMQSPTGLSAESLAALGRCVGSQDAAERELLARQAAQGSPKSALAQYLYARELHAAGRPTDAISAYREANRLDDAVSAYHYDLGNAFFDDKRHDEAIAEYARAVALDPSHAESHENFIRAHEAKGDAPDAVLAAYRALVAPYPDLAAAHVNLGRLLARLGKFAEAVDELHKACDLAPMDPVVRYDLGHVLEQAGKETEAFYEYKEAIKFAPNYAKVHNSLGRLYEARKKDNLAVYYYTQAVKFAPDYAAAWANLGVLYGKRDKGPLEIEAFKQQARLTPTDPAAHYNLGVALQRSGDAKGAIERFKKALELSPDDKPSHWQLAHAYERARLMNLAAAEWRKVLSLAPTPEEKATAERHMAEINP